MHPYALLPSVLIRTLMIMSGLFVDGALCDMLSWPYPKPESSLQKGTYAIRDASEAADMNWCLASTYLLATPLGTYLPRSSSPSFSHSPPSQAAISQRSRASLLRYIPRFYSHQNPHIRHFHLAEHVPNEPNQQLRRVPLINSSKNGLGVPESLFVFSLFASSCSAPG